jgi:hypothetical protein
VIDGTGDSRGGNFGALCNFAKIDSFVVASADDDLPFRQLGCGAYVSGLLSIPEPTSTANQLPAHPNRLRRIEVHGKCLLALIHSEARFRSSLPVTTNPPAPFHSQRFHMWPCKCRVFP